jgi:hypothetical protein
VILFFYCCFAFALTVAVLSPASQTPVNQALPCQIRAANRQRAHEAEAPTLVFEVATPSSTEPTVSTLTTEEGGEGEEERDDGVREESRKKGERLPSFKSVFDCSYIKINTVNDGKDGWKCGWCGKIFAPRRASRALWHVMKMKGGNVAVCKAAILDKYLKRYQALYDSSREQIDSKKHSSKCMYQSVALHQEAAVGNLLRKRGVVVSGSVLSLLSESPFSSALAAMSTSISVRGGKQNSFALSSQRTMSTMNLDIWKSNNATVEETIANFFHCKNIPDADVESPRFIWLVCVCCLVREDFVVPNRKQIGGDLLDLNYANVYKHNKANLLKLQGIWIGLSRQWRIHPSNGSDEHPCHVRRLSTHDDIYSRLYKAHGGVREERCFVHSQFV